MKELTFALVVTALIAGISAYFLKLPVVATRPSIIDSTAKPVEPPVVAPKKPPKAIERSANSVTESTFENVDPIVTSSPIPPPAPVRVPAPVIEVHPVATEQLREITLGMPASAVVERLGAPALTAFTTQKGSAMETYVYRRQAGRDPVLIRLTDGKVAVQPR